MTGEWLAYCQSCVAPEIASVLNRSKIPFHLISGYLQEAYVWNEVKEYLEALKIKKAMQQNRVGLLGHYYNGMLDVYSDITKQAAVFGNHFERLEMGMLKQRRDAVKAESSKHKIDDFAMAFDVSPECEKYELERAAKTAIALEQLIADYQLGSLAYYYEGVGDDNYSDIVTSLIPGLTLLTGRNVPVADDLSAGLPIAMFSRRPDVRSAELSLQIANTQVGISQANMYPALNITAGGGLESFKASNWFNIPESLFGLAGATIAQPVLRKRALKTQYEVAKLEREQAVVQFRQSVLKATGEISDALVKLDKLDQQEKIVTQQADTLQRAVFNAQLLFKSDMANYLEVITAQSNALQAKLNLVFVQRQHLDAMVELYRSLGGGWK